MFSVKERYQKQDHSSMVCLKVVSWDTFIYHFMNDLSLNINSDFDMYADDSKL